MFDKRENDESMNAAENLVFNLLNLEAPRT